MKTLLSFVIPCYRSQSTIEKVIDEIIVTVQQKQEHYDYEIICVNDASPDGVYDVLKHLAQGNAKILVMNLAKNKGKHAAVMAGYSVASGDYIVNLDDDCQSPTYELWNLLAPVERDEYDYATAQYYRKQQSAFKNFGSNLNLMMSCIMLGKPKDLRFENFSVMERFVMLEMLRYTRPYPYLEGLVLRVTNRIARVPMEQRIRGDDNTTGFTLLKSISLWLNGLTAFSVKPLRVATLLGIFFAILGFLFGLYVTIHKLMNPEVPAGYTTIIALLMLTSGITMFLLGIIGEYVGRIYICINAAPQYVIRDSINIKNGGGQGK